MRPRAANRPMDDAALQNLSVPGHYGYPTKEARVSPSPIWWIDGRRDGGDDAGLARRRFPRKENMKRIGIFTAVLMGMATASAQTPSPPGSVLSAAGGRFVFGQISEYRRDQYLLDTQTGRVWRPVCVTKDKDDSSRCSLSAMEPIDFLDSKGNLSGVAPSSSSK